MRLPEDGSPKDPRFVAALKQLERTGMDEFNMGFTDNEQKGPLVWWTQAVYSKNRTPHAEGHESAAGTTPLIAVIRLLEYVVDGSMCKHCERPAGIETEWRVTLPFGKDICWYQYDPSTQEFIRGCA